VSKRNSTRALLFNAEGNLTAWTNKTTGEVKSPYSDIDISNLNEFAFSGIHIFSPRLFKYFGAYPEKFSIIDFYLNSCKDENIKAYTQDGLNLLDVGKLDSLEKAEEFVKSY
jgi:NDP-sugar pyrophosphorylase family protein